MQTSSGPLFKQCIEKLESSYGRQEAQMFSFLLLENLFSVSRAEILADKKIRIEEKKALLNNYLERLLMFEPIQYILGRTEFYGNVFEVNPSVLIPRPETEELVDLIFLENKNQESISILDIGTGSGCIAISLKKAFQNAKVFALDISQKALVTAKRNALLNKTEIEFLEDDILVSETKIPSVQIIVSNPPYVLPSEKTEMKENVLSHEPHLALFATESDPLVFYKAIVLKAANYLLPKGRLYFEINEQFGQEVSELFTFSGFIEVKILKDLNGKDRIVRGEKG